MYVNVGFSTTNAFLSAVIRYITRAEVSHTWISYFDKTFDQQMVMEAGIEGVRIVPYEFFSKRNKIVKVYEIEVEEDTLKIAGKFLGEKYDISGLLGGIFVIFGRWFKRKWRNIFQRPNALFCSEFVVTLLKLAKYPNIDSFEPSTTNPQDLLSFLRLNHQVYLDAISNS